MTTISTTPSGLQTTIDLSLGVVRRRLILVGLATALAWGFVAAIAVLLLGAWLDLAVDFNGPSRIFINCAALAAAVAVAVRLQSRAMRLASTRSMTRLLDQAARARGEIVTGLDLAGSRIGDAPAVTAGLARIAVRRAVALLGTVSPQSVSPVKPLQRPVGLLSLVVVFITILGVALPRLVGTQWLRFADPLGDHPPYSSLTFTIQPGDAKVTFGSDLDVQAMIAGGVAEHVDLVLVPATGAQQTVPMFPSGEGVWQATLADVENPGAYFIRAGRARSQHFNLNVMTIPQIQRVTFRVTLPAYTNRPPYEGPLPQSGLAGLPGTTVQVTAQSNRPLSGGQLELTAAGAPQRISMTSAGQNEAMGQFVINAAGRFDLRVVDVDSQMSSDSFGGSIALLKDERPTVRLVQPYATSFATPDAIVKALAVAEDDYGISKLEIYRGLNGSRFRAQSIAVPTPDPTQLSGGTLLPLAAYNLVPSDTISLFARVEDNDPAGPKGAESPIATIRIVSQAQMDRMMLQRNAMQVLESKYAQAARRLEALRAEADKLAKDMAGAKGNEPLSQDQQKKFEQLQHDLAEASIAINSLASHDLPIDLDKAMKQQLEDLSKSLGEAAKTAGECTNPGIGASGALDKLNQIRKKLGENQDDLNKKAELPLAYLAKIYPLMQDEMRFIDIYNRQKDVAGRVQSLKDSNPEDPEARTRMRDLQDQQHEIRNDLATLLDDIDNHVNALPDDKQLDKLRNTARDFVQAVRASPADSQMGDAETALGQFTAPPAAVSSQQAADTLSRFIGRCQSMGGQGGMCLRFQPELSAGLGDSISQLLSLSMGSGSGYMAAGSSLDNVGLYGTIPLIGEESNGAGGQAEHGVGSVANGSPDWRQNPDGAGVSGHLEAAGQADAPIPPQYKQRVGDYFQRVDDELSQ